LAFHAHMLSCSHVAALDAILIRYSCPSITCMILLRTSLNSSSNRLPSCMASYILHHHCLHVLPSSLQYSCPDSLPLPHFVSSDVYYYRFTFLLSLLFQLP
jgi:hypothetical protein